MPARQPRTDRVTLEALLTSGKLTPSEQTAFQQMFDDLMGGKIINLSPKQRLWADSVWEKYKVGDMRFNARRQARARIRQDDGLALDKMPRPLKPPGRS